MQAIVVADNLLHQRLAAPGGIIGINLGLLIYAEDVAEYSSVIAHEMAHLSQRHFARRIQAATSRVGAHNDRLLAAILAGAAGGSDAGLPHSPRLRPSASQINWRFSREREQEADRVGLSTLVRANIDPNAMARMFERMQQAYRFTKRPLEFLLTHPLSESRISDAKNQARVLMSGANRRSRHGVGLSNCAHPSPAKYSDNPAFDVANFRKSLTRTPDDSATKYGLALALSRDDQQRRSAATDRRTV